MRRLSHGVVILRPPHEEDYPLLVALRNRERHWFGDEGELRLDAAAAWFASRHDDDRLLCIESDGKVVGTIGWTRVDAPGRIYEVGRLIADYRSAREDGQSRMRLHRAVRIAIVLAMDYLVEDLRADTAYFRRKPGNSLPGRLYELFGLYRTEWPFQPSDQDLECWTGNRADWAANRSRVLALIGETQADTTSNKD